MPVISATEAGDSNVTAFLDAIAWSEGTSRISGSDNGYDVIVGGSLFHDYATHPNVLVKLSPTLSSTAAGRYQLLHRYWVAYSQSLHLPDFSPLSQDRIAIQQLKECGALHFLENDNLQMACTRACRIWASLPGAPYGQHTNGFAQVAKAYQDAGGVIA